MPTAGPASRFDIRARRARFPRALSLRAGCAHGDLAPQLLQAVVLARGGREDVNDDVEVVHQDPIALAETLDAARQRAVLALAPFEDAIVDRFGLTLGVARAD